MFLEGHGNLPMLEISTARSTAEIYLHGAHITHFKKKDELPVLFLSQCSQFQNEKAIRGGVPIVFPWFGPREGMEQHGFARTKAWHLREVAPAADGSVSVRFRLPNYPEAGMYPPFLAEYIVTVNEHLTMELAVTNKSKSDAIEFENCLHSYFLVEDISAVSVHGLKGVAYADRLAGGAMRTDAADAIRFSDELDRTYLDTAAAVEIHDEKLGRVIRVEKENSASTVVWNPWIAKAQQMADFGNEEYRKMVCVESGNVMSNKVTLQPGETSSLKATISTRTL